VTFIYSIDQKSLEQLRNFCYRCMSYFASCGYIRSLIQKLNIFIKNNNITYNLKTGDTLMSKKKSITTLSIAAGTAFVASLAMGNVANAAEGTNPFAMNEMSGGYMQLAEGKCGGSKKPMGEGKCGEGKKMEGKCGEGKKMEGKCGEGKKMEGKCGEGKKEKKMEGKCGEGKCGGNS